MKQIKWIVLIILLVLPTISHAEKKGSGIRADVIKMPLLDLAMQLEAQIENSQPHKISELLPDFNWQSWGIDEIRATTFNKGKDVFCFLGYSGPGFQIESRDKTYITSQKKIVELSYDYDKNGYLFLINGSEGLLAYQKSPLFSVTNLLVGSTIVRLDVKKNTFKTVPIQNPFPELPPQYFLFSNTKTYVTTLHDLLTGKKITDIPSNVCCAEHYRKINKLVVGGEIEWNREEGTYNFIWGTYSDDTKQWKTIKLDLDPKTYFQRLLPATLKGMHPIMADYDHMERIAPDGSIVFRIVLDMRKQVSGQEGFDHLRLIGLVKQPQEGKPKLLTWAMYHSYDAIFSEEDPNSSYKSMSEEAANDTFHEVWYPGGDGKTESHFIRTDDLNDFLFDIDGANNSVIFLLQGELWSVKLTG